MIEKISVIVPIYRVPDKLLRKCIESIITQTYEFLEIILVDDGSHDHCSEICDEYANMDERIIVIHQENQGLAGARFEGVKKATSDYIMFVDGDDFIDKDACKVAVNVANKTASDVIFWNVVMKFKNSEVIQKVDLHKNIFFEEDMQYLESQVLNFNANISHVFAKLIRKEILLTNSDFARTDLRQGAEDLVFNVLLFHYSKSAIYIDENLNYYNFNESSITHTFNEANHYLIVKCFEFLEKFFVTHNEPELCKYLYDRFLYVIVTVGVSGFFNPENKQSYKEKKKGFQHFLKHKFVSKVLKNYKFSDISGLRRMLILSAKLNFTFPFYMAANIRRRQLKMK